VVLSCVLRMRESRSREDEDLALNECAFIPQKVPIGPSNSMLMSLTLGFAGAENTPSPSGCGHQTISVRHIEKKTVYKERCICVFGNLFGGMW